MWCVKGYAYVHTAHVCNYIWFVALALSRDTSPPFYQNESGVFSYTSTTLWQQQHTEPTKKLAPTENQTVQWHLRVGESQKLAYHTRPVQCVTRVSPTLWWQFIICTIHQVCYRGKSLVIATPVRRWEREHENGAFWWAMCSASLITGATNGNQLPEVKL